MRVNYSSEVLRKKMKGILEDYENDITAREAIEELADSLNLKLEPSRVDFTAYIWRKPMGNNTDVAFYSDKNGGDSWMKIEDHIRRGFGNFWGGAKVKVTIEEVLD